MAWSRVGLFYRFVCDCQSVFVKVLCHFPLVYVHNYIIIHVHVCSVIVILATFIHFNQDFFQGGGKGQMPPLALVCTSLDIHVHVYTENST